MRKIRKDKKINYITLSSFLIVLCAVLLSIGWSAFQSTFNIGNLLATVRIDRDIRVTGVQVTSTANSGRSNYEEYNVSSIYSGAYLPNQNSTITYKVEVANIGNVMQGIYGIEEIYKIVGTNTDSDLEIKSTTLVLKSALCDDERSSICFGSVSTFDIEIGYKENGYDGTHQTHSVTLNFDFRRVFDITYNGFGNTSGLDSRIMQGDTKTIEFNSTTGIPANTTTTGATGSYNPTTHELTLSNITVSGINGTITVSRHYGITYVGFTGNTNNLPTNIIYTGGTISLGSGVDYPNSVTVNGATGVYNDQTHTIAISNITSDITITASYSSSGGNGGTWETPVEDTTTTTYDPNNVPEGTTLYTEVAGEPKVTADENGNITAFEYTNTGSGVSVPTGGLDTGVLAFDGNDFTVILKAEFAFNNCTVSICPIINVSKKDPTVNGVLVYEYREPKSGYAHNASGSNVSPPYNKFRYGKYENSKSTGNVDYNISSRITNSQSSSRYGYNSSSSPVILTFKLYYINGVFTTEIYDSSGSTDVLLAKPYNNTSYSFTAISSSFDDITVVVGEYDGFGDGVRYPHNFNILEFSVQKS